jgi:dihydroorotate dehydrogenase (fumarate)
MLTTRYLGLQLDSPLVAAASPMTLRLQDLERMCAAGAGAVVLGSLFEDRFRDEQGRIRGADDYCELVWRARAALPVPVIASINAASIGAWVHHATSLQQAGASALELDLALFAGDPDANAARIERDYLDVVAAVRLHTDLQLAVKLPPAFTSLPSFLLALAGAGAGAAVLFRRPQTADVDLVHRRLLLADPVRDNLGVVLRWLSLVRGRGLDLAASGGVRSGADALKAIAAGADVVMVCSALLQHGPGHLAVMDRELRAGLAALGCAGLGAIRGAACWPEGTDPVQRERVHFPGQCSS